MGTNTDEGSGGTISSVGRAFNIVESLERMDGARVSELADELDLPRSTAHVYLKTLREAGYVVQDGDRYQLGLRFLKHGGYTRHRLNIYQAAKSEVDELSRRTGEVCDLGIEENGKRVLLYKSEGPEGVTQKPVTGEYTHMHMTALGKALLSVLPRERVEAIVDRHGLPRATQHTISTREELFEELTETRERGYSLENQERREGIRAIGTSIRNTQGDAIGAISISGPMSKLTDERLQDELAQEIANSTNIIEIKHKNY